MTEHGKKAASSGGVELYVIMHGQGASGMFHNTRGNAV